MNSELRITKDGSHTLFVPEIDECYHSTHGAIQESMHIFINASLKHCSRDNINILEIGFGTGLNAFLALLEAERSGKKIHYTTIEKYPVKLEKAVELNYPEQIDATKKNLFLEIHSAKWGEAIGITSFFSVEKIKGDFTLFEPERNFDVIFFDAFSPEKQPEMWTVERFKTIYEHSNSGATMTTYCAKGAVRRAMQAAGFVVERLPGPPGKREILRGTRL